MTNSDDVRLDIETTRQQSRYAAVENRGAEGHPRGETHTMRAQALMHALVTGPPLTESAYITVSRFPPLSSPVTVVSHVGPPTRVCTDHFRYTRTAQTPVAERVRRRCLRGQPL